MPRPGDGRLTEPDLCKRFLPQSTVVRSTGAREFLSGEAVTSRAVVLDKERFSLGALFRIWQQQRINFVRIPVQECLHAVRCDRLSLGFGESKGRHFYARPEAPGILDEGIEPFITNFGSDAVQVSRHIAAQTA